MKVIEIIQNEISLSHPEMHKTRLNTLFTFVHSGLKAVQSCRYLVADAALYVKETIVELSELKQLFITRVPQNGF